jgi:hypothetical protein
MKKVFIVTYIGEGAESVETVLSKLSDFEKWLEEHNKRREDDGNEPEDADEFSVDEVALFEPQG